MKKLSIILAVLMLFTFAVFAAGSSESEENKDQGKDSVKAEENETNEDETDAKDSAKVEEEDNSSLGDYSVVIDSCRLAKDYEGKDVIIVKYIFSNVSNDTATSFMVALNDAAFQDGVGLNEAFVMNDSADYSADNQMKEIKAGASIDVEVAYVLNDTTTDVEIEVSELISFDDKTITKTFTIAQ